MSSFSAYAAQLVVLVVLPVKPSRQILNCVSNSPLEPAIQRAANVEGSG
jgi:hypothetical protein